MENPSPIKELFREFALINRKSVFADQARIEFPKGEADPFDLEVHLTPTSGPFREACVKFSIKLPNNYPRSAPTVKCLNRVFHPNVSTTGNVCFSMFSGDWNASYRLEHYINGLLWFLQNPNPDSALNSTCSIRDPKEFEKAVRSAIAGLPTRGKIYDRIIMIDSSLPENILQQFFTEMVARGLALRAMLDAYTGVLPELSWLKVAKGTNFDGEVIRLTGVSSSTIAVRAKRLNVAENLVMKELVLRVGTNFVLALARGPNKVSFAKIAALFSVPEAECRLASVMDVTTQLKLNYKAIPAFGHGTAFACTLIEESVAAEPTVAFHTATGVPNLMLKTTFAHMQPLIPNARIASFLVPTVPAAPIATAAAVATVAPATPAAATARAQPVLTVVGPVVPAPVAEPTEPFARVAIVAPVTAALAPMAEPAAPVVATAPTVATVAATVEVTQRLLSLLTLTPPTTLAAPADPLARQQQRSPLSVST